MIVMYINLMLNTFLQEFIEEEIYTEAPPRYSEDFNLEEGCWLKWALYGLKTL